MRSTLKLLLFSLVLFQLISSCRKDDKIDRSSSARLEFSVDTVIFDTVFSTVGSVTKWVKIRNKNKNKVIISSISILGNTTQFRMNVDGFSGRTIKDVEIPGNDSIFMFVEVTVNPNDKSLPFLITDQIQFITNGNDQRIDLVAYGQNAIFYTPNVFPRNLPDYRTTGKDGNKAETTIWTDSLPIVIYGYLVVDSLDNLIIRSGTQIYLHGEAGIWVYREGNIRVLGTKDNPVVFQGDRLDAPYNELSGQWDRIWINEGSFNNRFEYAIIKHAFIGIQAETLPFTPRKPGYSNNQLELFNTVIENCSALGLLATNYRITAKNTIISDAGAHSFGVSGGGVYNFDHCTFGNYWTESTRTTAAIVLVNSYTDGNGTTVGVPLEAANFRNCIIYGSNESEFDFESIDESVDLNFSFENCIVKTDADTNFSSGKFTNCILNPKNENIFKNPYDYDFHLSINSPAINSGVQFTESPPKDLDGVNRFSDAAPDIGAYEYVP